MDVFGPWTTFLRKTGGVITGNLTVMGTTNLNTLGTSGLATLDSLAVTNLSTLNTLITSGLANLDSLTVNNLSTLNTLITTGLASLESLIIDTTAIIPNLGVTILANMANISVSTLASLNNMSTVGSSILNGLVTINDQLLIVWDDSTGANPHVRLRSATVAGTIQAIIGENESLGFNGAYYTTNGKVICLATDVGGQVDMPSPAIDSDPKWKVNNLTEALPARRMLMLHSIMFGI